MNLEIMSLRKINHSQKDKYCTIPHFQEASKVINFIEAEIGTVVAGAWGRGKWREVVHRV